MSADALLQQIATQGAGQVLAQLKSGPGDRWRRVTRAIETGAPGWVQVARGLLSATDAGDTESLFYSLAIALSHNAEPVLASVGPEMPLQSVCAVPFIEPTEEQVRTYLARVRAALGRVKRPDLQARKEQCVSALSR